MHMFHTVGGNVHCIHWTTVGENRTSLEIVRQLHFRPERDSAFYRHVKRKLHPRSANGFIRYAVWWVESGKA